MTMTLPSAASPLTNYEPCCDPGQCLYKPESTRRFSKAVRSLKRARLDIATNASSLLNPSRGYDQDRVGRSSGGGSLDESKYARILGEVERAMRSARNAINGSCCKTPAPPCQNCRALASRLCPFALEDI